MAQNRPLSPHISIWKWRVYAITSITHRITGNGIVFVGLPLFAWWLAAAAIGDRAYEIFSIFAGSIFGWICWIGLSWASAQHLMSGIRHLVMDPGWGYSRRMSRLSGTLAFTGAIVLTLLFWALYFTVGPGVF